MAQARDAKGRFTSSSGGGGGGGGGHKLGNAYGEIRLDGSGVQGGVNTALKALDGFGARATSLIKTAGIAFAGFAVTAAGALATVAAVGVRKSAELEAKMSDVKAVMQITEDAVASLRSRVLELGVDPELKVSAMQAAAAVEMLGRNGLKTQDILDGAARSTILLQNATGSDFAQAADIATDVMALFSIRASEMTVAVDGITSVVNNSKFSITDYQYALAQAGGIAATAGVSFDDLNTTIAAIAPLFADGSSAGAGFKVMLQRMANPTGEMAQVMRELNLMSADGANLFYTEAGEMKSMSEVAKLLADSMGHLTDQQKNQALSIMFGTRSVNAAAGLMRYGTTVTMEAAEAMGVFGVSMDEATAMVERGITEFDLLQAAMGNTSAAAAAADRMNNLSGSIEILKGVLETLSIRIGDVFNGDARNAVVAFTQLLERNADRIVAFFAAVRAFAVGILSVIRAFFGSLSGALAGSLGKVNKESAGWGQNIVVSLARGMAAAATAVVRVLQQIGQIITRWLRPGSPPALLPEIDDWGTGTIDAWLSGFTSADFSIFDDLADVVERHLRNIAPDDDETLIERILGSREALADIIREIRETGVVGADAFQRLQDAAGPLPDHIRDYMQALFELEAAQARVAQAQQRLDAIRGFTDASAVADVRALAATYGGQLGAQLTQYASALERLQQANAQVTAAQQALNQVTQKYSNLLSPLNAQLQAISDRKQDTRDAERMAELEEIIADERLSASERELAQMELEEIQLRRQIRDIERERDTAVGAAEDKLQAAKEAAEAAKQAAAQQQAAAMALAQAELDAAKAQQDAAKERMDVAKFMLAAQEKQNDLLKEQTRLLEKLADTMSGLGGSLKDALGDLGSGSGSILGDIENGLAGIGDGLSAGLENAAGDIEAATGGIEESISQMVANIEAEFAPLTQAASDLGTTWGGVATTLSDRWNSVTGVVQAGNGRLRGSLDRLRGWFDENREPILSFANDTYGQLGRKAIEVGGSVRDFALRQLQKFSDWTRDNQPLIQAFGRVMGTLALVFLYVTSVVKTEMLGLWDVVEPLLDGLVNIFLGLVETVMNLATGEWGAAWQSFIEVGDAAWAAIGRAFTAFANWVTGWFGTSWRAVAAQWRGNWALFKEIVRLAWAWIVEKASGALEAVRSGIEKKLLAIQTWWATTWQGIAEKVSEALEAVRSGIEEKLLAIQTWWATTWQGIAEKVSEALEAVRSGIEEKLLAIRTWWATTWQGIEQTATDIFTSVKAFILGALTTLFEQMGLDLETMRARWSAIWADVELIAGTIWERILAYIDEKVTAVKTAVETRIQALQTWWDSKWTAIQTFAQTTWESIRATVDEKVTAVKTAVETRIQELQTWWDSTWTAIQTFAETTWESIRGTADEKVTGVKTAVETRIQELQTWWDRKWGAIKSFVVEIWQETVKAIADEVEAIYRTVTEKIAEIEGWIEGKVDTFQSMGANLLLSMADGVRGAIGDLIEAITSTIEGALAWAKQLLGIASPSTIFTGFGEMSIQGLINGLASMRERLERSVAATLTPAISLAQQYSGLVGSERAAQQLAYANLSPAPATPQPAGSSTEHYHFYGNITVTGAGSGSDLLRDLKQMAGRG